MLDNHNNEEYWKGLIELQDDSEYINEIAPAYAFFDYAPGHLKSNFIDIKKNKKDPPDFFLELKENHLINLEVTALLYEIIPKTNKFLKKLEETAAPLIEKHKNLLPPGTYIIIPYSDRGDINNMKLEEALNRNIPEWFKKYSEDGNADCTICNISKAQVVKLKISKVSKVGSNNKIKISIWPPSVRSYKNWSLRELKTKLQGVVDKKEKKYSNRQNGIWWLLISDRENLMNTTELDFEVSEILLKVKFFKKVFLIREENKVDELNVQFA